MQITLTIVDADESSEYRIDAPRPHTTVGAVLGELLKLRRENQVLANELSEAIDELVVTKRELRETKARLAREHLTPLPDAE